MTFKEGIYSLLQSSFIQSPYKFVSVVCSYQYYFVVTTTTERKAAEQDS